MDSIQYNDDFFTLEEIISKKSPKSFFGSYKKRYDYKVFDKNLNGIVFDPSQIGENPVKLVRSMLLFISNNSLISVYLDSNHGHTYLHHLLFKYILTDDNANSKFPWKNLLAGLIYVLGSRDDWFTRKVIVSILAEFLDAQQIDNTNVDHRGYIFSEKNNIPLENLISEYHNNVEPVIPYIKDGIIQRELQLKKRSRERKEKDTLITFLTKFAGFTQSEIDYVIDQASQTRAHLKLSEFSKRTNRIFKCMPGYLEDDLKTMLDTGYHPKFSNSECAICWSIDKPGSDITKCKIHNKSLGRKLHDRAVSIRQQSLPSHLPLSNVPLPSAPPLQPKDDPPDVQENNITCDICMNRKKNCTLIPCGHCFCLQCISNVDVCPNCREKYTNIQKIFI